ncbi:MAG: rRNA (uracil1939-C5)-methyltransferase [Gammaproteobacteria bacterium]|jgi:23S rRNA (uracil1939-C5)-methyltransferase|nr:rRNA (uracil1939-C5)-methyltransferase [Gammaproteobacteria bacterium]
MPLRCGDLAMRGVAGPPTSCPHRPPCPACPRFGERGIATLARDALDELAHAHGLPQVTVISGKTEGFRLRARLAIRGRLGSPKLGLFELGTHRVVHIPNCSVQHPLINRVAAVVRRALVDARVTSYSDGAHRGLARYLQVVVERSSQTAQVVIVANSATSTPLAECFDLIRERLGSELHSLWYNANGERSNTILGPEFQNWCGSASVVERFGGEEVHYPPGAFGQNNLDVAQRIIEHVRAQIPQGARVAEFYAGVGAIGLSVLDQASQIRMNEVSPHSLYGLELGLAQLDSAKRAKISIVPGPAGAARLAACDAQVVIADPPRKGLDPELTDYLIENPPERFVYVSCGLASFLHDAARLTSHSGLRLDSLTAFNLMPFTDHVEIVARFERA